MSKKQYTTPDMESFPIVPEGSLLDVLGELVVISEKHEAESKEHKLTQPVGEEETGRTLTLGDYVSSPKWLGHHSDWDMQ